MTSINAGGSWHTKREDLLMMARRNCLSALLHECWLAGAKPPLKHGMNC